MALQTLDGTSATVDLSVVISGTVGSSLRCIIMGMEYRRSRGFQDFPVLCDGKWANEKPGRNQDFITFSKLTSKGSVISDLSPLITATAAASIVFTADTLCTYSGSYWLSDDSVSVAATQIGMPGAASFRSAGPVTTAWVTS